MLKLFFIPIIFFTLINAKENENQNKGFVRDDRSSIGVGVIQAEGTYKGDSQADTLIIPLFYYNGEKFYIRGIEYGFKKIDTKHFKVNLLATPRLTHYDSKDSIYLEGMDDREMTLEAGFALVYKPHPLLFFTSKTKFDTLFVHKGFDSSLSVGIFLPLDPSFFITATIVKTYLSRELANYYYGVKDSEKTATRDAYNVGTTHTDSYKVSFIYKFTKDISSSLTLIQTKYSNDIANSPIVEDSTVLSTIFSISHKF